MKSYDDWRSLEVKEALHQAAALKTTITNTESLGLDTKPPSLHKTSVSLTRPFSELFSAIENQRIELETHGATIGTSDSQATSVEAEMPPNKRKKLN